MPARATEDESLFKRAREWLAIFAEQYRVALAVEVHYRASAAVWMIGAILEPVIFLVIWSTVAVAQGGSLEGMTPRDFAAYYIAVFVVGEFTYSWNAWEFSGFVRRGDFSVYLMRPVHPVTHSLAANFANKTTRMVIVLVAALAMTAIFRPAFQLQVWSVLLSLPALALATAIYFALDYLFALTAFWMTNTTAVSRTFDTAFILFSGYFAPLHLFPPLIGAIAWALPFRWVLAFPVELFLGALTPQEALVGLLIQCVWLGVLYVTVAWLWRRALRQYSAVGG